MEECPGPFLQRCSIVLASSSPRRQELLGNLGIRFSVVPGDVPEPPIGPGERPEDYVLRLARLKAKGVHEPHGEAWTIGADTAVAIDSEVLGKPESRDEAFWMLKRLSGNMHRVYTGCWFESPDTSSHGSGGFFVESKVWIARLSDEMLRAYVATGEPMDKAGSYAVQGMGAFMVERIEGSYTNVIGLPLREVVEFLISKGILAPKP